jgi:hypothetical protein
MSHSFVDCCRRVEQTGNHSCAAELFAWQCLGSANAVDDRGCAMQATLPGSSSVRMLFDRMLMNDER